jgi:hypothetical protein
MCTPLSADYFYSMLCNPGRVDCISVYNSILFTLGRVDCLLFILCPPLRVECLFYALYSWEDRLYIILCCILWEDRLSIILCSVRLRRQTGYYFMLSTPGRVDWILQYSILRTPGRVDCLVFYAL